MARMATDSDPITNDPARIDSERVRLVMLSRTSDIDGAAAPQSMREHAALTRAFDVITSAVLLVVALPVLAVAALLVRLTSPGPVIYRQVRSGQHGRPFTLYKFRTMVDGADALLDENLRNTADFRQRWKLDNDPRVTRVGSWLRRTSIDELPQLYNVLRGDMSVVGPRPVPPDELVLCYRQYADRILSVKPGLTGLWQVEGRSAVSYETRIELDLEYLERRSLWFDMLLLLRTVPAVLTMRGAV